MLQYPINVYPDNVAFDSTKETYQRNIHFTNKGDFLTCAYWRLYNYDTQEIATVGGAQVLGIIKNATLTPLAYNNEEVQSELTFANLPVGRYILQMMLTQTRTNKTNTSFINIYDRYVSRGKLTAAYTTGDETIKIEDKVNVIYEWNKSGDTYSHTEIDVTISGTTQTVKTSAIIMQIGNESVVVDNYNAATGEIELESALQNDYAAGTPYKLYANYLITEQYYFEVAIEPEIQALHSDIEGDVWATWNARGGKFEAFYWQGQYAYETQNGTMLKYYTVDVQKKSDSNVLYDVASSGKIYSQDIEYNLYDDYDVSSLGGGNSGTKIYKFILNCVLQNGMTFTKEYEATQPNRDLTAIVSGATFEQSNKFNSLSVGISSTSHSLSNLGIRIYRIEASGLYNYKTMQDKTLRDYPIRPIKTLIGDLSFSGTGAGGTIFNDYTASNHAKYQYVIVPYSRARDATTIYQAYVTDPVETNFYGYTLTALKDTGKDLDGKNFYMNGDTWKFMGDIQDTDNAQNLNRVSHVGAGKYASVTSMDNDYISGTLTAALGNMNCSTKNFEDDIEVVKAFRRFIAQDCLFILRSQKGDVWLVKIADSSSTKYEEDNSRIPVSFTFTWVEVGSLDNIIVQNEYPDTILTDRR